MTKWRCLSCGYEVERPEGKLPPIGEAHNRKDSDGVMLMYGTAPQCPADEFRKVPF